MPEIKHIKNPLTVIVVFAGLSEVFGTLVLPHLNNNTQDIFIWFVMGFPILLIGLFFYTLHKDHKVLYAPSDYKDENNFFKVLETTDEELEIKIDEELSQVIPQDDVLDLNIEVLPHEVTTDTKTKLINKEKENSLAKINYLLAEKISLKKLENDLDIKIDKNNKIITNNNMIMFDGVFIDKKNIHLFEVKLVKLNIPKFIIKSLFKRVSILSNDFTDKVIILHLVLVIDNPSINYNGIEKLVLENFTNKDTNFTMQLHVFNFNDLKNEVNI